MEGGKIKIKSTQQEKKGIRGMNFLLSKKKLVKEHSRWFKDSV
jgi:hypothetical protein